MHPYHFFFYVAASFCAGVALASIKTPLFFILLGALAAFAAMDASTRAIMRTCDHNAHSARCETLLGKRHPRPLSLLILAACIVTGSAYFAVDDHRYAARVDMFSAIDAEEIEGVIIKHPVRGADRQTLLVAPTLPSLSGTRILVFADPLPAYTYGDVMRLTGTLQKPPPRTDGYGRYLAKERVHATMFPRDAARLYAGGGSALLSRLYTISDGVKSAYRSLFSHRDAALLAGITLGSTERFSPQTLERLSRSGTRHLTALSGLHITIVVFFISSALYWILPRHAALIALSVAIFLFIAMTGFKISAMRAAAMASIAACAPHLGRIYKQRNAIALAALVLVLLNPKVLLFDIGFQLSFLATVSIVYLSPLLGEKVGMKNGGFLKWKEAAVITASAQIATAPILIAQFQNFSLTAIAANVLILPIVPPIMVLGFSAAAAYAIFPPLATLLAVPASALLSYVHAVIALFSDIAIMVNPHISVAGWTLYYCALIAGYVYLKKRYRATVLPNSLIAQKYR